MEAGHGAGEFKDLVVFLAAAGVMVPLFNRFKISPVLGFLAAGVLLGPDGLGRMSGGEGPLSYFTITDQAQVRVLSELGVAFLLFMIGLELSWERLKAMRRLVFGLGLSQVILCALALGGAFYLMGQPLVSAIVLGLGLGLSSTAVVMPVLAERGRLAGSVGRSTFAVLLAQDLAVAPILITVTVLASIVTAGATPAGELDTGALLAALSTLAPAAIGLALLIIIGRLVLRPLFRLVARAEGQELFLAACLLVVIGAGVAAQASGLSMSLGALIAGLLLAETEFRRAVEVAIEPFKGLLLGVFFVGVGIGLDLDAVAADPLGLVALTLTLIGVKVAVIFGLARAWGLKPGAALQTALVLGPAGEFAFVILAEGMVEGVASPVFAGQAMIAATLSIFTIPFLAMAGDALAKRRTLKDQAAPPEAALPEAIDGADVLVVGYGRVGRLVGEMLREHGQSYLAIDTDIEAVREARRQKRPVSFGDASRADLLNRCGIDKVRALVVTMDSPGKVEEVVRAARALRDDLTIIARARDDRHAQRLYAIGVTDAVPETIEASLQLAENTLVDLGVPMGHVIASIHERRDQFRKLFLEATPEDRRGRPNRALRASPDIPKS
ncbi:cation:proton antiporter [Brevundimonas sp.]|uniref:cation:proton antiporter domain-containing protein n=1 Tax=Brevundimonas sp. TaxID=1871086 RepID=UPI0035B1D1D5